MFSDTEEDFLLQINQFLPKHIDWKSGARRYLHDLVLRGGESYRRWHYTKPFIAEPLLGSPLHNDESQSGVDKYILWHELYPVLNILRKVDLPPNSSVLDVACGPGWISHFIGKIGHRVLGVDISEEMLNIARERIAAEPFPPYPLEKLNVNFLAHDVEESPIPTTELFDLILIDSALHHFLNPMQALRNLANHLAPRGVIAIIEGVSGSHGPSPIEMAIMQKYHTLERPYSRQQLQQILNFSGFSEVIFYEPINGLIESGRSLKSMLPEICFANLNCVIASKNCSSSTLIPKKNIRWLDFYQEEKTNEGDSFRWSPAESSLEVIGFENLILELKSIYPTLTQQKQVIQIHLNGEAKFHLEFQPGLTEKRIELRDLGDFSRLQFFSDAAIYPFIHKLNEDKRQLAFMVKVIS